jgi:hypothetical protein
MQHSGLARGRRAWQGGLSRRLSGLMSLALAVAASGPVLAQGAAAGGASSGIYSCIDDKGRRLTSDRPIAECNDREQRILNRDGSTKAVQPPTLTADERAAVEARERKAAADRAALIEATRRDKNLLARYPNEAAHRKAREAALDTVRAAIKGTQDRIKELQTERKPLLDDAEFYKGKPLPPKLKAALDANDASMEAQKESTASQQAELDRVNRLYDAELVRLRKLWAGAPPGSTGATTSTSDRPVVKPATASTAGK